MNLDKCVERAKELLDRVIREITEPAKLEEPAEPEKPAEPGKLGKPEELEKPVGPEEAEEPSPNPIEPAVPPQPEAAPGPAPEPELDFWFGPESERPDSSLEPPAEPPATPPPKRPAKRSTKPPLKAQAKSSTKVPPKPPAKRSDKRSDKHPAKVPPRLAAEPPAKRSAKQSAKHSAESSTKLPSGRSSKRSAKRSAETPAPAPPAPPKAQEPSEPLEPRNPENDPLVLLQVSLLLSYSFETIRLYTGRVISTSQSIRAFERSVACFESLVLGLRLLIPPDQLPSEIQRRKRKSRAKSAQARWVAPSRKLAGAFSDSTLYPLSADPNRLHPGLEVLSLRAPPSPDFIELLHGAYSTPTLTRVIEEVERAGDDPKALAAAGWLAVSAALCSSVRCFSELMGETHPITRFWPSALVQIHKDPVLWVRSLARQKPFNQALALCKATRDRKFIDACSPLRAAAIANAMVPVFSRGLEKMLEVVDMNCLGGLPADSDLRPPKRVHRSRAAQKMLERKAPQKPKRRLRLTSRNPWVERELRAEAGRFGDDSYDDLVAFIVPGDGE